MTGLRAVMVWLVWVSVAQAAPGATQLEAKRHLERGNQLYQEGRYAEAIGELETGYAIDPRPDVLYALGQAERKRGDCKTAIAYYRRYLDTGPTPQRTAAVQLQIDRCTQEAEAAPVPAAEPERPAPAATPPVARPTLAPAPSATVRLDAAPVREPKRVYQRWWLWTTLVGVVAVGVGLGVGLGLGLDQPSGFDSTLPDLVIAKQAALVRF